MKNMNARVGDMAKNEVIGGVKCLKKMKVESACWMHVKKEGW